MFRPSSPVRPSLQLSTAAQYSRLAAMVSQTAAWQCRVPVGADAASWLPFVLPLWGVVEGDHLHVDNRLNFALHADGGRVVAVAAYPVRDKFQFIKQGTLVALHGPVRWFDKGTYTPLAGAAPGEAAGAADAAAAPAAGCGPLTALLWAAASATMVRAAAADGTALSHPDILTHRTRRADDGGCGGVLSEQPQACHHPPLPQGALTTRGEAEVALLARRAYRISLASILKWITNRAVLVRMEVSHQPSSVASAASAIAASGGARVAGAQLSSDASAAAAGSRYMRAVGMKMPLGSTTSAPSSCVPLASMHRPLLAQVAPRMAQVAAVHATSPQAGPT